MKVLGMRASTSEIRYAILAKSDDGTIVFVNNAIVNSKLIHLIIESDPPLIF